MYKRQSLGDGGGSSAGYINDAVGRPQAVAQSQISAGYTYDPTTGLVTLMQRGGVTTTYGYNSLYQLTDVTTGSFHYHCTYDGRGRRYTRSASQGQSWYNLQYDDANRLLSAQTSTLGTLGYSYDTRGNRLSGGVGQAITYTINSLDQATGLQLSNRGYGVAGHVAPGAQVKVFHPLAPNGQLLVVDVNGNYSAWWPYAGSGGVEQVPVSYTHLVES